MQVGSAKSFSPLVLHFHLRNLIMRGLQSSEWLCAHPALRTSPGSPEATTNLLVEVLLTSQFFLKLLNRFLPAFSMGFLTNTELLYFFKLWIFTIFSCCKRYEIFNYELNRVKSIFIIHVQQIFTKLYSDGIRNCVDIMVGFINEVQTFCYVTFLVGE